MRKSRGILAASGRGMFFFKLLAIFFVSLELTESRPPFFDHGLGIGPPYIRNINQMTKPKRTRTASIPWPPASLGLPDSPGALDLEDDSLESRQWLELETVPPSRVSAKLHSEVVLECVAVGSPPPIVYWLKDGKPIESLPVIDSEELLNGLDAQVESTISGFSMSKVRTKLPIRCIRPEDEGLYTCVAKQIDGPAGPLPRHASSSATVIIDEDDKSDDWKPECEFRLPPFVFNGKKGRRGTPAFIHAAESLHMEVIGNSVVLPCKAGGKPKPRIQWLGSDGLPVVLGKKYQINTKGDLVIRNLSWSEMGEYKCTVTNPYGSESIATFVYPLLAEDR